MSALFAYELDGTHDTRARIRPGFDPDGLFSLKT